MVNGESVGAHIRAAREARGMSMSELARAARLSPGAVSRIEHGEREPGSGTLAAIARALGVEPGELMGGPRAPGLALVRATAASPQGERAGLDQPAPEPDQTVLQAIQALAQRMPYIPPGGRQRILAVILALLDGDGRHPGPS